MAVVTHNSLIKTSVVLGSTLLTLLALEVGLRLFFAASGRDIRDYKPSFVHFNATKEDRRRFTSHPFLPYAPRPFDARKMYVFRQEIGETVVTDYANNSLGFRTPERPFRKPPLTKRVVTLGGSTTYDGPTNEQTWPALLEKRLNEHYAGTGHRVEVINLAVDMASSPYSLVNLAFLGVEYEPDLIVSYDGVNDAWVLGYEGLMPDYRTLMSKFDEGVQTLQSRLPAWAFGSYAVTWASFRFDRLRGGKRPDVVGQVIEEKLSRLKPSPNELEGVQYFQRNLRLMRAISGEYGAKFLAATAHWARPPDKVVALNEELRAFFARERMDFVDVDRALPHDDWSIHVDEVHWTLKGVEMMAEQWGEKIIAADALGLGGARQN